MSVECVCKICGKSYFVLPYRVATTKYCSKSCMDEGKLLIRDRGLRRCCICREIKAITDFAKDARQKSGYDRRCLVCTRARAMVRAHSTKGRYDFGKSLAKRRNYEWALTLAEFEQLISFPCIYCNGPLNPTSIALDRKDNYKGYTVDNAAPCCSRCNMVKGHNFTYDEMIMLGKTIQQLDANRKPPIIPKNNQG